MQYTYSICVCVYTDSLLIEISRRFCGRSRSKLQHYKLYMIMPPPESSPGQRQMESGRTQNAHCRLKVDDIEKSFPDNALDTLHYIAKDIQSSAGNAEKQDDIVQLLKEASVLYKIRIIADLSLPVITSYLLYSTTGFVIMYFAGHLSSKAEDPTVFAGISMANMFANVSCFSILIGMTSSVETLASQNNGAQNYREVGLILQRSVFILSLMLVPIAVIWLYTENIFLALGTDRRICVVMGNYLRIRMLTMPVDVVSKSYEKYLCCLGLTKPAMYSQVVAIVATVGFGALFVHRFHWGYESLAVAFVISTYLSFVCLIMASYCHPSVQRTLTPLSIDALNNLKEFVVLGIPGMLMLCSEWWAYELLTLFASQISAEAVASQTIIIQCAALAYMVPLGVSVAATTTVGNALGSGDITLAKEMSKLTVYCGLILEAVLSMLIVFFADSFISFFSDDSLVLTIAKRTVPILAVMTWVDGLSSILGGITRGAGQQHLGAYANIAAYYCLALPLAWYLCFHTQLGVIGLISGISSGPLVVDIVLWYFIFCRGDYLFAPSDYSPVSTDIEKGGIELTVSDVELERDDYGNS